jgi:hypothetical protein
MGPSYPAATFYRGARYAIPPTGFIVPGFYNFAGQRGYSGPGWGLPPVSYGIAAPAYRLPPVTFGIAPTAYGPTTYGLYSRGYRR